MITHNINTHVIINLSTDINVICDWACEINHVNANYLEL